MADIDPKEVATNLINQLGKRGTDPLKDADLAHIARKIINPAILATHLGIREAEMENIKHNNSQDLETQKFKLLSTWRQRNGNKATLSRLVSILCENEYVGIAEEICTFFKPVESEIKPAEVTENTQSGATEPEATPTEETDERKPKVTAAELEEDYEKVDIKDDDNQEIRKNPIVLIEVVNDTEFKAVISTMKGKVSRHNIIDDLTNSTSTYYLGNLGDIQVVVVQTATKFGSQFQYGSWFETKKALYYFDNLKYIFAVGVCGAIIDKQSGSPRVPLGEVVILSHIIGYDHRKILDGNTEDRGHTEDLRQYDFYNYLHKIGNQEAWRNKIHFGKVLSGSWLVASLAAQHFLLHPDQPDKKAVEMEGVGIAAAACKVRGVEAFLVVKGVSDYANSTKNDNWQPHAAKEAASFLSEMLNKYLQIRGSRET